MIDEENHYGFRLSDELILLRDQIRRFMREEVKPIEDTLPHDAIGCGSDDRIGPHTTHRAGGIWGKSG